MTTCGWAAPRGDREPTHWWQKDGRRACDQENNVCFTGPKMTEPPTLPEICIPCLVLVSEAAGLLGVELWPET